MHAILDRVHLSVCRYMLYILWRGQRSGAVFCILVMRPMHMLQLSLIVVKCWRK